MEILKVIIVQVLDTFQHVLNRSKAAILVIELLLDEVVKQGEAITRRLLNLIQAVLFGIIDLVWQRFQIIDTHDDVLDFRLFFDATNFHLLHGTPDFVLALI